MKRTLLLAVGCAVAVPSGAAAQDAAGEVLAVVERLFDGMRQRDTVLLASLFDPGARLWSTGTRDGQPANRAIAVADFIAAVGRAQGDPWIERIYHPKVEVNGNLASVWTWYTFHLGDRLSHCGVDAFQLVRGAEGWRIVALADTRRTEGCEEVPLREPAR